MRNDSGSKHAASLTAVVRCTYAVGSLGEKSMWRREGRVFGGSACIGRKGECHTCNDMTRDDEWDVDGVGKRGEKEVG